MTCVFISAGEASGDMYAAWLLDALRQRLPDLRAFGCAGPRLRASACEPLLHAEELAMVGLAEVATEIPRVWRSYRRLVREALDRRPDLAILVDSPDFNLRLARHIRRAGVPVLYLVAPQAWAWRPWRVRQLRRVADRLLCIFPFEEAWFRERGVKADYIGHPLTGRVRPQLTRDQFCHQHHLDPRRAIVVLLPGSRRREAALNLPPMAEAAAQLEAQVIIAVPAELPLAATTVPVVRGATYDAVANADLAIVASGTITIETAMLGTPMVVVYRVTQPTYYLGRLLVSTPFYSMVNLVAGRRVVPELIQADFTAEKVAREAQRLLRDGVQREQMRAGLAEVTRKLTAVADPMARAAGVAVELLAIAGGSLGSHA